MADLEGVISASLVDAGISESVDTGDNDGGDIGADNGSDVADTPAAGAEGTADTVTPPAGTAAAAETVTAAEQDELDKELEALGIPAFDQTKRENRLPYRRMKKIFGNAQEKWKTTHKAELAERDTKLTAAEQRLQHMDSVDALIASDPDRYVAMLAAMHPDKYSRFVGRTPEAAKPAVDTAAADPKPEPDGQYADGTPGYTPAGMEKLLDWRDRQTAAKLKADYEERLKPLEEQRKTLEEQQKTQAQQRAAEEHRAAQVPKIKAQVAHASKTWGKLFDDDYAKANAGDSEILKVMQANDGKEGRPFLSFDAAVAQVLTPKLYADRNTMREELLKEINGRPAAADRTPGSPSVVPDSPVGERNMEDVIRQSIAHLKR